MSIELISKHRGKIMAAAMLWIAIYHSYFPIKFKPIAFVTVSCGYVGVDVFVFLSAFGLYYAYKKEHNYLNFTKRRVLKILPYVIPICIYQMFSHQINPKEAIAGCLGLSIFVDGSLINWFASFILIMYLFTPIYLKVFMKKPLISTIVGVLLPAIFCGIINKFEFSYVYLRCSVFFLGFPFAYALDKKIEIKKIYLYLIYFFMIFGWALMYYLYHYCGNDKLYLAPIIFITPGNVLLIASVIDKTKCLWTILDFLGKYTFQFYLIHLELVKLICNYYGLLFIPGIGFDWLIYIAGILLALLISIIYKRIIDEIIIHLFDRENNKILSK